VTIHSDVEPVEDAGRKVLRSLLDLGYLTGEEMKTITGEKARGKVDKKAHRRKPSKPAARGARKARPTARAARVAKTTRKAAGKRKSR